jgi:predicted CoA-binding protein
MSAGKTLVLGASEHPDRYSYLAVQRLRAQGYPVVALGNRPGQIGDVPIVTGQQPLEGIDTVTLYLNPQRQEAYYNYILSLHPRRIIFNPGTENEDLQEMARAKGIETLEACTLVMLASGQY